MNAHTTEEEINQNATKAVLDLFAQVPGTSVESLEQPNKADKEQDLLFLFHYQNQSYCLVAEVKENLQPRSVRNMVCHYQWKADKTPYSSTENTKCTYVLITTYLTPKVREICRNNEISYLDFYGNARLSLDGLYIEREVAKKPPSEQRGLKGIFGPKSAKILKKLLANPSRTWRVADLSEESGVSIGQVSNVRKQLIAQEWARVPRNGSTGFELTDPDAILDAWEAAYKPVAGERKGFYSPLHGKEFEDQARKLFEFSDTQRAAFASFSAAKWLSPYARTGSHYFYCDKYSLEIMQKTLKLTHASKGENVVITIPKDAGIFDDLIEPVPGIRCTSAVQTYLDLSKSGERGKEAADHLRRDKLAWKKK